MLRLRQQVSSPVVLAAIVALTAGGLAGPAAADPFGVRLSGAADPSTTMGIGWNSDDAGDAEVIFGTAPAALTETATADVVALPDELGTGFSIVLRDLTPATRYHYRVGRAGRLHPAESEAPFSFLTLDDDPCAELRFVVAGDNRADTNSGSPGTSDLWPEILGEAVATEPHLLVNTGDMVKNGDVAAEWNNLLHLSEPVWSKLPSITTVGNHDTGDPDGDGALYNRLFTLPTNPRTASEDYYSIDAGTVHFVSLNSQHTSSTELAEMAAWVDDDLAATRQPWKIVFFHKAIYTRGNHSTGEEDGGILNSTLIPIFDRHHVDVVFNGHSHDYERYVPSRGVDQSFGGQGRELVIGDKEAVSGLATLPDGATGTTYIVTGGGGARTTDIPGFDDVSCIDSACTFCSGIAFNCERDVLDVDKVANVVYDGSHHFVAVTITGNTLHAVVDGTVAGNGNDDPERIDEVTIQKPGVDACRPAGGGEGEGEPAGGEGEGEGEAATGDGEGEAATGEGEGDGTDDDDDDGDEGNGPPGGCGCASTVDVGGATGLALLSLVGQLSRRRRQRDRIAA